MLRIHNVHKKYGTEQVLQGISLEVPSGTVLGLLGGNGAGKSTLLKILAGILKPDQGEVALYGVKREEKKAYTQQIGYVPQGIALSPQLTVRQNLEFWGAMHHLSGNALKEAVEYAAELGNVGDFMKKKVKDCSGGMMRRVNLAAGMIHRPALLLLDEPTAGVDEENRLSILRSVCVLGEEGCIVLLVSHYRQELEEACNRLVILEKGTLCSLEKGERRGEAKFFENPAGGFFNDKEAPFSGKNHRDADSADPTEGQS